MNYPIHMDAIPIENEETISSGSTPPCFSELKAQTEGKKRDNRTGEGVTDIY